jgi:hypothetical protein
VGSLEHLAHLIEPFVDFDLERIDPLIGRGDTLSNLLDVSS